MSFYRKYELERLIADGEAKTFRAVESATGRTVFLHLFNPGGQALLSALKAKLAGPDGKPVPPLIEIGEFAGSPYAVTEDCEAFPGLREWVNRLPEAVLAPGPAPLASPGVPDEEPGEFTRLFAPQAAKDDEGQESRLKASCGQDWPPSGTAPVGEFTRAFGPAPKPPNPPPVPPRREAESAADTGEFTKLFGSGLSGEAIDIAGEQAKAARTGGNESRPFQRAGEFTRIFGPEMDGEAPASPPAAPLSLNTSASGVFSSPDAPAPPEPKSDPGEYTRIFGEKPEAQKPAEAGKPAAANVPVAAQKSPQKPKPHLAAIAGIAAAVVVLVALIVLAIVLSRR